MTKYLFFSVFFTFFVVQANAQDSVPLSKEIYSLQSVDVAPQYPGGTDAFYKLVSNNFKVPYPEIAMNAKIFISFVIEKDGSLSDIKVLRDPGYGLGQEAKRVVALSEKWSPAIQSGNPVRVTYSLPINVNAAGTPVEKPIEDSNTKTE